MSSLFCSLPGIEIFFFHRLYFTVGLYIMLTTFGLAIVNAPDWGGSKANSSLETITTHPDFH